MNQIHRLKILMALKAEKYAFKIDENRIASIAQYYL